MSRRSDEAIDAEMRVGCPQCKGPWYWFAGVPNCPRCGTSPEPAEPAEPELRKPLRKPMYFEPFIEANLGSLLPSRPYVVRNSYSAPLSMCIPGVKHRNLAAATQDLLDCRARLVERVIERQARERAIMLNRHKAERGER